MRKDIVIRMFLVFLFMSFGVNSVQAYKIEEMFDKPIKDYDSLSEEAFLENSKEISKTPFYDKDLAFTVRIPSSWQERSSGNLGNISIGTKLLTEIVSFHSKPRLDSERSFFKIKALELDNEVTVDQWFYKFVMGSVFNLEGIKVYDERKLEAIHVEIRRNATYVIYTLAQINGKKIVLAQYEFPVNDWEQGSAFAQASLRSFKFQNPNQIIIQDMEEKNILDIAIISYPRDWILDMPSVRSVDRVNLELFKGKQIFGKFGSRHTKEARVFIDMIASHNMMSLEDEIEQIRSDFRKRSWLVGSFIEDVKDVDYSDSVEFGFTKVYEIQDINNLGVSKSELWLSAIAIENYFYMVTLLTQHRENDFYQWSKNTGSYRAILKKIRPQEITYDVIK